MNLSQLQQGQTVNVRHGRAGEQAPNWGPWHAATLDYLRRREVPLPKRLQKRSNEPNVGDIIGLAVSGWPAEYSQSDYCGQGCFLTEDWYLEIEGLE